MCRYVVLKAEASKQNRKAQRQLECQESRQTKDVLVTLKPAHSETKPDTKVKQTRNTALLI